MKQFLALTSKHAPLPLDLARRVAGLAAIALPFRDMPYRTMTWVSPSGAVALWAWDNEESPSRAALAFDARTATALAGYVVHPTVHDGRDVASVRAALPIDDRTVTRLGGSFALAHADGRRDVVQVWNTVHRSLPIYWAETPEVVLVGTGVLLISLLISGGTRPDYEPANLAPFIAVGYFMSDLTPFRAVAVMPANAELTASRRGVGLAPIDGFARDIGTVAPNENDYDELTALLIESVAPFAAEPIECAITGGKDSRLIAAALKHAGIPFTARTTGFADHPDVIVGQRIAAILGVPHRNPRPRRETMDERAVVVVDPLTRARERLRGSDGMLSAFEFAPVARRFVSTPIQMGGACGERLRSVFAARATGDDALWRELEDQVTYALRPVAEFWRPDLFAATMAFWSEWAARERARHGSPAVAFMTYRTHFVAGRLVTASTSCRYGCHLVQPFNDNRFTKAVMRVHEPTKRVDALGYNLLLRLAPELIDVPFAQKRWNFEQDGPRPGDEDGWRRREPLPLPRGSRGAFDWRRCCAGALYDVFYDQIFADRSADALFDVVDRGRLLRRFARDRGTPMLSTSRTLLYWGLFSASVLLSNRWLAAEEPVQSVTIPLPETASAYGHPTGDP